MEMRSPEIPEGISGPLCFWPAGGCVFFDKSVDENRLECRAGFILSSVSRKLQ